MDNILKFKKYNLENPLLKLQYKFFLKQFVTFVMKSGKKTRAEYIVNEVFIELRKILKKEMSQDQLIPVEYVFLNALYNARLLVSLKKIKHKRFIKYIPFYIMKTEKQLIAGLKIILNEAQQQSSSEKFSKRIALEIWNSFLSKSASIEVRNNIHVEAYKNRLNAHYRWPTISKN